MTLDHRSAIESYLAAYARLEAAHAGFERGEIAGLPCFQFGKPKGELWREVVVPDEQAPGDQIALLLEHVDPRDAYVTVLSPFREETRAAWQAVGFTPFLLEYLMGRECDAADTPVDAIDVREVLTSDDARRLNVARGSDVVQPTYLDDPHIRTFVLEVDGSPASSATLIRVDADTDVVENVATLPAFRRRGHAARLLRAIHAESARTGAVRTVLVSGAAGRPLYEKLGYAFLRYLHVFVVAGE
jgi:GNAT superfamily N-acetyltransferase